MLVYSREIKINETIKMGGKNKLVYIIGPCVLEDEYTPLKIAEKLKKIRDKFNINLIFKSSFDKANRTSLNSFRGIGLKKGLKIFNKIKEEYGLPIITDIHLPDQAKEVANIVDIIQIPAFLIRQTDLVISAAKTKKAINLKKGQFLSPWEMEHVAKKVEDSGNKNYFITERGTFFGYNRLVNDFKYFPILKKIAPLCFDSTHSLQLPGLKGISGGEPQFADNLSFAATASFVDALFFETHFTREEAKSDSTNLILLTDLEILIEKIELLSQFLRSKIF